MRLSEMRANSAREIYEGRRSDWMRRSHDQKATCPKISQDFDLFLSIWASARRFGGMGRPGGSEIESIYHVPS